MNILIIGGTELSMRIVQELVSHDYTIYYSCISDIFLLNNHSHRRLNYCIGRKEYQEFCDVILAYKIDFIVDASHPFSIEVQNTISNAAVACSCPGFRICEEKLDLSMYSHIKYELSHTDAARNACSYGKSIFYSGGSHNCAIYAHYAHEAGVPLIVRVLPRHESLTACFKAQIPQKNIIAAYGPFTELENIALFQRYNIGVCVTKESSKKSGLLEKITAAEKFNIHCIIIKQPQYSGRFILKMYSENIDILNLLTIIKKGMCV